MNTHFRGGNVHRIHNPNVKVVWDSSDNLPSTAGLSALDKSDRTRPPVGPAGVNPIELAPVTLPLELAADTVQDPKVRCIVLGLALGKLFRGCSVDEAPMFYGSQIIVILSYVLRTSSIINDIALREALRRAGVIHQYEILNSAELRQRVHTTDFQRFKTTLGDEFPVWTKSVPNQLVAIGIYSLLIAKHVLPASREGWLNNRIRAFNGTMGLNPASSIWIPTFFPDEDVLESIYFWISAHTELRRVIFNILLNLSYTPDYGILFQEVVNLLRGAEMGPFLSVDYYLGTKYRELFMIKAVRGCIPAYSKALELYLSWSKSDRQYAKILLSKDETAALSRNYFPELAQVAMAVGRYESPTMKNYKGVREDENGLLLGMVTYYLDNRVKFCVHEAMLGRDAGINPDLLRQMAAEFDKFFEGDGFNKIVLPAFEDKEEEGPTIGPGNALTPVVRR